LQTAVVDRFRFYKLISEDTGNLVKALNKRPDKAQEILEAPTDHLVRFFQDTDGLTEHMNALNAGGSGPVRTSPIAQQIIDFLPALNSLDIGSIPLPELRQIEDSLTSLKLTVEGLLKGCKTRLGG
jgi:hypothetical protein